jgi:hypothetical protein
MKMRRQYEQKAVTANYVGYVGQTQSILPAT